MTKEDIKITRLVNRRLKSLGIIDEACELIGGGGGAALWGGITGTLSDQTDLQTALDGKEDTANKGIAGGYASLDGSGLVPSAQLPSYVDDILEFANLAAFPVTGEAGKIYVALDSNFIYRWSGSAYVQVNAAGGDSLGTGFTSGGGSGTIPNGTTISANENIKFITENGIKSIIQIGAYYDQQNSILISSQPGIMSLTAGDPEATARTTQILFAGDEGAVYIKGYDSNDAVGTNSYFGYDNISLTAYDTRTSLLNVSPSSITATTDGSISLTSNTGAIGQNVTISAGGSTGAGQIGGVIDITAGNSTLDYGGDLNVTAGNGDNGGNVYIISGAATGQSGGEIGISAGSGILGGGGPVGIRGGNSTDGNGGTVTITGGNSDSVDGGDILINGGNGDSNGGNIIIAAGNGANENGQVGIESPATGFRSYLSTILLSGNRTQTFPDADGTFLVWDQSAVNIASIGVDGSALSITQTWNTATSPTAIKLNITNTASGASSNLMDLQVGGVSKFKVDKSGNIVVPSATSILTAASTGFFLNNSTASTVYNADAVTNAKHGHYFTANSSGVATSGTSRFIYSQAIFAPTSGTGVYSSVEIGGTLNQTGGANGITRSLYLNPTLTAVADYYSIDSANGKVRFTDTNSAGSGTLAGAALSVNQTWNTSGSPSALLVNVTNTASGGNAALMDLQVGGGSLFTVYKNGSLTTASGIAIGQGNAFRFGAQTALYNAGDGILALYNGAFSSFDRIQFGGDTTSFPALKRASAGLEARLADDSAYTTFKASNVLSGTYTPTVTNSTNCDSAVTVTQWQYSRTGNVVTFSGRFTADPTTLATNTSFEFSLPIASNLGAAEDLAGTAFCGSIAGMGAAVFGISANDTGIVQWVASDVTSKTWSIIGQYEII